MTKLYSESFVIIWNAPRIPTLLNLDIGRSGCQPAHLTQEKLGSLVFQKIAVAVTRKGKDAELKISDFPSLKTGSTVQTIIRKVQALGEIVPVIRNNDSSNILVDLSGVLSTGIKDNNEKKRFLQLRKLQINGNNCSCYYCFYC